MTAYYNEFDPFAAAWLRALIAAGHIAPGIVDERDLWDVSPDDLRGFTQVHLCAGIGVWSYALRCAGWPDDRPVWTASFPCQPFSAAGKGLGFADERHLWPAGLHLIRQCDPPVVVGEQVASKDGLAWLDLVRADMEGTGRTFAAADLCAAGVGAPHIRQRAWWLAVSGMGNTYNEHERAARFVASRHNDTRGASETSRVADSVGQRLQGRADQAVPGARRGPEGNGVGRGGVRLASGMEQPCSIGRERRETAAPRYDADRSASERPEGQHGCGEPSALGVRQDRACPTNGFWRDADWLYCRDGKWRPVEPGTFPLVDGTSNRVGRLRGYGNAITAPVATTFIQAVMEII